MRAQRAAENARLQQASFGLPHTDYAPSTASRHIKGSPFTMWPTTGGGCTRRIVITGEPGGYVIGVAYFAARISRSCTARSGSVGPPLMFHALNTTTIS